MKSCTRHPLRVTGRVLWLGVELLFAALKYAKCCAFCTHASLAKARAEWLQQSAGRVLRVFRAQMSVAGSIPQHGMLVCNHLGYLDILILAALTPSRFVAKSEVRNWPVFGWFSRLAGTIFVERNKRSQSAQSADEIAAALREGSLVVLFPEGTSSGGESVLPFKSSLLEPAARDSQAVTAGLIAYELTDGVVSEEVCYWKDMTLLPHLINLLSKRTVHAFLHFAQTRQATTNRKALARQLHSEVVALKTSGPGDPSSPAKAFQLTLSHSLPAQE